MYINAHPYVYLFTQDGRFSEKFYFKNRSDNTFKVNKELPSSTDSLFIELNLFYCREGKQGLCLTKKVLMEAPLTSMSESSDWTLIYKVEEER